MKQPDIGVHTAMTALTSIVDSFIFKQNVTKVDFVHWVLLDVVTYIVTYVVKHTSATYYQQSMVS